MRWHHQLPFGYIDSTCMEGKEPFSCSKLDNFLKSFQFPSTSSILSAISLLLPSFGAGSGGEKNMHSLCLARMVKVVIERKAFELQWSKHGVVEVLQITERNGVVVRSGAILANEAK